MKSSVKPAGIRPTVCRTLTGLVVAAVWLLIWQLVSLYVNKELFVPGPLQVLLRLSALVATTDFWRITLSTIVRITIGFSAGTLAGVAMAVLTSRFRLADAFFRPAQQVIKATPIASFIILALVWIKGGNIPSFISFLMVLPIVWANVSKGISQTDPALLEMGRVYRFSRTQTVRQIYVHSVMPYFAASATTSMGLAWKAGIAAEVLAVPQSAIGTAIYDSKIYLETVDLFAWSLVVILFSILLEKIITVLLRRVGSSPAAQRVARTHMEDYRSTLNNEIHSEYSPEQAGVATLSGDNPANMGTCIQPVRKPEQMDSGIHPGRKIILENISFSYGEQKILDSFSAELPDSGCVCFSGPSGQGKTTLFQIIAGLIEPDGGRCYAQGMPWPSLSYVFQDDRLLPWLSAVQNVETVIHNKPQSTRKEIAAGLLAQLGLAEASDKRPEELSGGMKQRVNIARALAFDARIVLLDEPFKGLDDEAKNIVKDIIRRWKTDRLILLITHDRLDSDDLADRIVCL
ncbi:MAG: ATP-binding cassette domain-containing protein [Saccharofermentanales bacterium]